MVSGPIQERRPVTGIEAALFPSVKNENVDVFTSTLWHHTHFGHAERSCSAKLWPDLALAPFPGGKVRGGTACRQRSRHRAPGEEQISVAACNCPRDHLLPGNFTKTGPADAAPDPVKDRIDLPTKRANTCSCKAPLANFSPVHVAPATHVENVFFCLHVSAPLACDCRSCCAGPSHGAAP